MKQPTLNWLAKNFSARPPVNGEQPLGPIEIDSRKITEGSTFWALSGNRDGHDYVVRALAAGAKACVISASWLPIALAENIVDKCIVVPESTSALTDAAKLWRKELRCTILGLTGSNGKTTTKDLITKLLSRRYKTQSTQGNFNNHLGVPLTLLSIESDCEFAVIEMGANAPNEIRELCSIARPDHALVTSIGRAHLEGFGSIATLAQTKGQLYDAIADHGVGFVPLSDELCRVESATVKTVVGYTFSANETDFPGPVCRGRSYAINAEGCSTFEFEGRSVTLAVPGFPTALASLAALTVAKHFGADMERAVEQLSTWRGAPGRGQVIQLGKLRIIDDSYNANPSSVRAALQTLTQTRGSRLAILGSMAELGVYSAAEHQQIANEFAQSDIERVIYVGTSWAPFVDAQNCYESTAALLPVLPDLVKSYDVVLLKGSHSVELDRAVTYLTERLG